MVCETGAKQLYRELRSFGRGELLAEGAVFHATVQEDGSLSLTTLLYSGGNYLPHSVRECIHTPPPLPFRSTASFITVDEASHEIFLNIEEGFFGMSEEEFSFLICDFTEVAGVWRSYIDDNDRKDLIFARV